MDLSTVMRQLCVRAAAHIDRQHPPRAIGRAGEGTYMNRHYPIGRRGKSTRPFNLYLQQFLRSDPDNPHSHPWRWALSLVLAGGYVEERLDLSVHPPVSRFRRVGPFRFNFLRGTDYHRVELLEKDCWTFFIAGPEQDCWGFLDRATREFRVAEPDGDVPDHVAPSYPTKGTDADGRTSS